MNEMARTLSLHQVQRLIGDQVHNPEVNEGRVTDKQETEILNFRYQANALIQAVGGCSGWASANKMQVGVQLCSR
jgi:hypothetical protein